MSGKITTLLLFYFSMQVGQRGNRLNPASQHTHTERGRKEMSQTHRNERARKQRVILTLHRYSDQQCVQVFGACIDYVCVCTCDVVTVKS